MKIPRSQRLALTVAFVVLTAGTFYFLQRARIERQVDVNPVASAAEHPLPTASHPPANPPPPTPPPTLATADPDRAANPELLARVAVIEARERAVDAGPWAAEMLAQAHGRSLERLWDAVNRAPHRTEELALFPATEWVLGRWDQQEKLPHDLQFRSSTGALAPVDASAWLEQVRALGRAGWQLQQMELRHTHFDPATATTLARSTVSATFQATNLLATPPERAEFAGELVIDWERLARPEDLPVPHRVDASRLQLKTRIGPPPFALVQSEHLSLPRNAPTVDPMIVYDLDGDGLAEVLLVARNTVYRRQPAGNYHPFPLLRHASDVLLAAVLADFDRDGFPDLLGATLTGLQLFRGSPNGTFDDPPQAAWKSPVRLLFPTVLTAGDVDGDGHLDVFLGQYKDPYEEGAIPSPEYDARNGNPSFLLHNEGGGRFADQTEVSGVAARQGRRVYSASFVDLLGDSAPELVLVSDFAGVDLFANDGHGRFRVATDRALSTAYGFGMAHSLADWNLDGQLDLLMIGMGSPTVDRLEHLQLWRPGLDEDRSKRGQMTRGNRLFLSQPDGRRVETGLSDSLARSGWSWGCAAADFDNDGFPDVYIGNGLESRETVHDYDAEYWLHDRYVGRATADPAAYWYFRSKFARTRGRHDSYGGYEKNRLYLNQGGERFVEVGHLAGVALEQDSRNVVAEDLDGDGRVDLLVTSFEAWPDPKPMLRIFRNELPDPRHHWIGFRFRESTNGSPLGAKVVLERGGRKEAQALVSGDSYRSQHPTTMHFGLGPQTSVEAARISWPDGTALTLEHPEIDCYHRVIKPSATTTPKG